MKYLRSLNLIFLIVSLVAQAASANTEKMDINDHNSLIEKLEVILPNLSDDAKKENTVQIRLADLYSERARLLEVKAGEENCTICKDADKDRKRAISLYEKSISKASLDAQKKSYLQLAHLYTLTKQTKKAEHTLQNVLKANSLKNIHPKALLGLADLQFADQDFEKALANYKKAEIKAINEDKAYISFRQSWCVLNLGQNEQSLRLIQKAVKQAEAYGQTGLKKDLMQDYATILARTPFTSRDVNQFAAFSTPEDRANNLKHLGEEADRLGNKKGALLIWSQYAKQTEENQEAAELNLKMAMNYFDIDQTQKTLVHLNKVVAAIENDDCADKKCVSAKSQFRSFLVNWNKKEKTEPSKSLVSAYGLYFKVAPEDFEALIWAAQIAQQRNDSVTAYSFYESAAHVAYKKDLKSETEKISTIAIEVAESTGRDNLKEQSYKKYLELNPNGQKRHFVRYQLAYLAYQQKKYDVAASEFKSLALDRNWKDLNLKIKSADLNLDSLAIIKQDIEVRKNSSEFAKTFKNKQEHFNEIGRKVTINRLVGLVAAPDASRSEIRSEIDILKTYPTQHLNSKDKIAHLKNMALAAEKISDIQTVELASQSIIKTNGATADDIEFSKKSLLWVAELKLEFKKAYEIAKSMKMKDHSFAQKELRMGLLAELAGLNPEPHFLNYIKNSSDRVKSNELRVKMIRRSTNKWSRWSREFNSLRSTPHLLASITLELHLQMPNESAASKTLAVRGAAQSPEGQHLIKLRQRDALTKKLNAMKFEKLNSSSDRALQKSMKKKISQLAQLKSVYTNALQSGDLAVQARALTAIETENRKFYSQIQKLPMPRGLKAQEKLTYKKLINEQSAPFLATAIEALKNRENLISSNDKAMKEIEAALTSSDTLQRRLAQNELRALRPFMNRSEVRDFNDALEAQNVSSQKIAKVRQDIRMNPLNTSVLAELRELEARRANGPLIAYLDLRIAQLKNGSRR